LATRPISSGPIRLAPLSPCAWAESHRDQLIRYIASYLECLRWVLDPLNHKACADILVEDLRTAPDIANETVELLRRPGFGLHPDAAIDEAGLRNTIALRASQQPGSRLRDPRDYIDLSYYAAALALAKPRVATTFWSLAVIAR
jgi:ABC-type nitrate/sulfonate/bicarbonate transport system substrate-binding protein